MPDAIIGQIDEKFFIGGVDGLYTTTDGVWMAAMDRLKERNISHILNVAEEFIYSPGPGDNAKSASTPLVDQLRSVAKVKIFGEEDVDTTDLSQHFEEMVAFIKEGRESGTGVYCHCRQGHSRGATAALSYLVLGTQLSLNAAFEKIHRIRTQIKPNAGFWRQLRELEASLLKKGVDLKENPEAAVSEQERAAARKVIRDLDQRDLGQRYMALSKTTLAGKIGQGADRNGSREKLEEIAHRIGRLLVARGETLAVSESPESNVISEVMLQVPGASAFYKGAANAADAAESPTEESMFQEASKIREQLSATWALSAAGLGGGAGGAPGRLTAAPTGNQGQPGQAMLAIAGESAKKAEKNKTTRKLKTEIKDGEQNILVYACSTLDLLEQALQEAPVSGAGAAKSKL